MSDELVRVTGLCRDYGSGDRAVHAVRDVTFTAGRGELVAVRGRSGAGKTTLLNMIGGLDRPTRGRVEVAGHGGAGGGGGRPRRDGGGRGRAAGAAPDDDRLRVPVVRPDPDPVGGGERERAAAP